MNEPLIFLTNDDGWQSKGFEALIALARRFGRVLAIAPETPQSGMSHAFSLHRPLYLREVRREEGLEFYACSGTPVDCVKMCFDHLIGDRHVDLVLSGINHGSNAAVGMLYSGTMGAAIEGSFYGCPSMGLSLVDHDADADFDAAVHYGARIAERLLGGAMPESYCLNVNVPQGRTDELRGIRVCRQARGFWRETFVRGVDDEGRECYRLQGGYINNEPDADDTDEWALAHGYVSVMPVTVDMARQGRMEYTRRLMEGIR